jgi:hypothetical protein
MRLVLFFIVFLLIGLAIVLGDHYWHQPQNIFNPSKPALTTKFSLANAPSDSLQGLIASVSGNVTWLSRTGSKPVKVTTLRSVQQGEELNTGTNGTAVLRIQNDASLLLLPNSHVSVIQLLPQNFVFMQDKGSIRYENTIQVPISVKSLDLVTLIIKGIVTITVNQKNQSVAVAVIKGNVKEGYEDLQNTSNVLTVNAGQTFVFDETNRVGSVE